MAIAGPQNCPVFRHGQIEVFVDIGKDAPKIGQRPSGNEEKPQTQASRRTNRRQNRSRGWTTFGQRPIEINGYSLEVL